MNSQNHPPLVSVVITTYYRNDRLRRAIDSVVNQSYENVEVIVVDDSGEEYARDIVADYEVAYIGKNENEGQIAAWNTGISYSNGSLVQFLDDDDELRLEKIEKQVARYQTRNCGVIYCGLEWEPGGTEYPSEDLSGNVLEDVLTLDTSPCVTSTMLIEQSALRAIYPLPKYAAATDDVLKIELAQHVNFQFVDEPLVVRGISDDNVSGSMKKIEAWQSIIHDYSYLYSDFPKRIKRQALAHIYYNKGLIRLGQRPTSPYGWMNAIWSFCLSRKYMKRGLFLFLSVTIHRLLK